jgi:iron complex outermembrane receptor protein
MSYDRIRFAAPSRQRLAVALALACSTLPFAAAAAAHDPTDLPTVQVTASPLAGDAESLARPVEVLQGEALDRAKAGTLGETVSKLPGVQTTYFGPGVGRPILRGLDGPRVQVLSGGIGTMDASTVSADHATSVEPFLADQIEVLKGPATLLFGSGAIGGAVNVADGRIARDLPEEPLSGRAEVRGSTVNDERSGMFRLDGVNGNWVLHVDGLVRDTGDYDIPGYAAAHPEGHDGHDGEEAPVRGTLPNSSIKTRAGALGATWLGDSGYFGVSASTYRSNYGIPGGAHEHPDDDGHDGHEGHDHADEAHGEENVRIDMIQNRVELKAGVYDPLPFLQSLELHGAWNDYEHVELEGGEIGTRFTSKGYDTRIEAVQQELAGWHGAFGLQLGRVDFGAIGEEAFVPGTTTTNTGVFVVEDRTFGAVKLELGGRYDRVELDPVDAHPDRSFGVANLSAAAIWKFRPGFDLRVGVDSSERAPSQEELYAGGMHVATGSIEIGDSGMDPERALRGEIGLHAHNDLVDFKVSVYRSDFNDFIYLADTGIEEDATPVRLWTQADAVFTGAEAEAVLHLADNDAGAWDLRLFGDTVRAKLDGSGSRTVGFDVPHGDHSHRYDVTLANRGYLPRIAPGRFGTDLSWEREGWRASLGAVHYLRQGKVAQNEEPSPAYTLVDAHLAYRWEREAGNSWEVFLDGSNLGDEEVRPHTSLLRDYAPLPGRAVAFGIRAWF